MDPAGLAGPKHRKFGRLLVCSPEEGQGHAAGRVGPHLQAGDGEPARGKEGAKEEGWEKGRNGYLMQTAIQGGEHLKQGYRCVFRE